MTLLALLGISDIVWQALIAGAVTVTVVKMQLRAAKEVREVKDTLATTTVQTNQKLDKVAEKVEEVHVATNSLTDRLVASTAAEALARGGIEERKRAEERLKGGAEL